MDNRAALRNDFASAHLLGKESLDALEAIGHYKANEVSHWLQSLPKISS